MNKVLTGIILVIAFQFKAQNDSAKKLLTITGYAEVYYCYDFSNPANHVRPDFVYSFNRHNEVAVNLAFVQASYERERVRSNLAFMTGTYAKYNLANEDAIFRHVFEASVGVKVARSKNLWVDAGIMPSHIGFESAIGRNCWNLTRSILADNSPYFETGVKLGYTNSSEKLYLAALILNGWQRIERAPDNQTPAFGTQLTYKPDSVFTFNWSTFIGNEFPDSSQKWRYFNNLYAQYQLTKNVGLTAGFDIGMQQKAKHTNEYDVWYSPVVILRVSPSQKLSIAARAEYYFDRGQVIISTGTENGFQTFGYSANLDINISNNFTWRIEGRTFISHDKIFVENSQPSNNNYFVTTSVAVSL